MDLLPTGPYTGPAPRYTKDQTVYHNGQPYTVSAVCGRAPLVGWVYEVDGPGEVLRVGEGEITTDPAQAHLSQAGRIGFQAGQATVSGLVSGLHPHPAIQAMLQHAAAIERQILTIQMLTGQPRAACERAALQYLHGLDTLIDGLKRGLVSVSASGAVTAVMQPWPDPVLQYTVPDPVPQPRLNRTARRSRRRPWLPPRS